MILATQQGVPPPMRAGIIYTTGFPDSTKAFNKEYKPEKVKMPVPQKRNEKKHRSRAKRPFTTNTRLDGTSRNTRIGINPYYSKDGRPMRLEDKPSFEEWLEDTEPVDTIEEMVNDPRRILSMAAQCDPDDDIANDFEELFEDY